MFVTALSTKFLMYVQNAQNIKKKKKKCFNCGYLTDLCVEDDTLRF